MSQPNTNPSSEPLVWTPDHETNESRRAILHYLMGLSGLSLFSSFELLWPRSVVAKALNNADQQWGTIKGQLVWDGDDVPEPQQIDLNQVKVTPEDKKFFQSQGPLYSEDWVVDKKTKGIRWVFVWLLPEAMGADAKLAVHPDLVAVNKTPLTMDQPPGGFLPHSIVMREGQELLVRNDSPIFHSVVWAGHPSKNPGGNQAMQPGAKFTISDLRTDRLPVRFACAPHPWEKAWIRVFDHPYFALTEADGKFEIRNVPAGKCRLVVWHETAGWKGGAQGKNGETVTIEGGAAVDLGQLKLRAR